MMIMMMQRVLDLESQLSSKSQAITKLNAELSELKCEAVNVDDLRRSVRDLQRQLDLARDSDDVTQQKNAELKQTLKSREQELEVKYWISWCYTQDRPAIRRTVTWNIMAIFVGDESETYESAKCKIEEIHTYSDHK